MDYKWPFSIAMLVHQRVFGGRGTTDNVIAGYSRILSLVVPPLVHQLGLSDPSDPQSIHENCWRREFIPYIFLNVPIFSDSFINIDPAVAFRESIWGIWFEGPAAQVFSHKLHGSIWYHIDLSIQTLIMYWLLLACWYVFFGPYNGGPAKQYF